MAGGGEYSYYKNSNKLEKVNQHIGNSSADKRNMNVSGNFVYDTTGNLIEDKYLQGESSKNALVHFYCRTAVYCALRNSKRLKNSYDWRGMPVEFMQYLPQENTGVSGDTLYKMAYDGTDMSNGVDFDVEGEFFDFRMNSNANIMMNSWFNEN